MMVAFVVEALLFRFGELKLDHGLFINKEAEGGDSYQILANEKSKFMPQPSILSLHVVTQPQQILPQPPLQFVRRQPVARRVGHESRQLRQAGGDVQRLAFHRQRRHPQKLWKNSIT